MIKNPYLQSPFRLQRLRQITRRTLGSVAGSIQSITAYRFLSRKLRPAIKIEVATEADMLSIYQASNPGIEVQAQKPNSRVSTFVAKRGQAILGYVQLVRHPPGRSPYSGYWGNGLFVLPQYRGMGVGEELSRRAISQAIQEHAPELSLLVFEDAKRARQLYYKLGFEDIVIPALEDELVDKSTGRRRVAMRIILS